MTLAASTTHRASALCLLPQQLSPPTVWHAYPQVELSKLSELNDSAGGYEWKWQKEARALQEAADKANGVSMGGTDESISALKLSMDNILMVR